MPEKGRFRRYLLRCAGGVLAAIAAVAARYLLNPLLLGEEPFVTVVIAVPITAWLLGSGPALLSLVLGMTAADYLFADPPGSLAISHPEHQLSALLSVLLCLTVIALTHLMCAARARAEEARQQAETRDAKLRLALGAANMGSWRWDFGADRLTADERCRRLFGFGADDSIGTPLFLRRIVPDDRPTVEKKFNAAASGRGEYEAEFRVRLPDNTVRWILSRGRTVTEHEKRYLIGVALDITAVKLVEENLRRHERELQEEHRRKDAFLATLAHELRNPLSAITAAVEILARPISPDRSRSVAHALRERTKQLSRLVEDLLDVSRVAQGKIKLNKEQVDLRQILTRAAESLRSLIEERRHQLSIDQPDYALPVYGDPVRLEQILANLIHNAAKYTPEGGRIVIWAARRDSWLEVHVKDNGVGISREELPRIFDLFQQAEESLHLAGGGLGIGLTLVQRLTRVHGGEVSAFSAGPGQGSEFTVRLPEAQAQPLAEVG